MTVPHHSEPAREAVALLPCPFCGGEPSVSTGQDESLWSHNIVTKTQVRCDECDIFFETEPGYEFEAPEAWNRRHVSASPAPAAGGLKAVVEEARSQSEMLLLAIMAGDPASELKLRVNDIIAALASPAATSAETQGGDGVREEDRAEAFIQAAIDSAPEPLRRLGEWLAHKLDDDDWKTADRLITGAAVSCASLAAELDQAAGVINDRNADIAALAPPTSAATRGDGYQERIASACAVLFEGDPTDVAERRDRFAEEANEVCQAFGMTREDAHRLVDYTYSRPVGDPAKEIGAAMTTLASLANEAGHDLMACAEADLAKLTQPDTIARIRAKRATRHGRGPLPGLSSPPAPAVESAQVKAWQPMNTAPKDGRHCILSVPDGAFFYSVQGAFQNGQWNAVHRDNVTPVAWMPNVLLPDELLPSESRIRASLDLATDAEG